MTIPTTEPHAHSLVLALRAAGVTVGLGVAPAGDPPYVVLYPDLGLMEGSLGDRNETLLLSFQVTAVGAGVEQALWGADKARAALLAEPPLVDGRHVHPIWVVDAQPARRDNEVDPPLFVATAQYQMRSDPA